MIEPAIADQFQPYLGSGERIAWTGVPRQGLKFSARDLFIVPFSVVWLAFAVFWESQVLRQPGAPIFMALWGAMFLVIGLFFFVGRFFVDAWIRRRTLYAITDRRALLLRWANGQKLLSSNFTGCAVERKPDGSGNLRFGPRADNLSFFVNAARRQDFSVWVPALSSQVEFVGLLDVLAAYRLVNPAPPAP